MRYVCIFCMHCIIELYIKLQFLSAAILISTNLHLNRIKVKNYTSSMILQWRMRAWIKYRQHSDMHPPHVYSTPTAREKRIPIADPARNYEVDGQTGNASSFEGSTLSPLPPKSGFRSQSRIYVCRKQGLPLRDTSSAAKMGERRRKKILGNAKSHLKPPGSGSSFEHGGGSQILFADIYIHIYLSLCVMYTGICI